MTKTSTSSSDAQGNDLQGLMTATATPENSYTLAAKDGVVGFYQYTGTTLGAGKAYLIYTGSASVRGFIGFDGDENDGATGIQTLPLTSPLAGAGNGGAWYTLDGRKLEGQPTQKGVYVNNGRKVVVK